MRKILFRGKRVDNGEWVYGLLCRVGDTYANIVEKRTEVMCTVLTNTVGQFTGMTDKNGKNIFEGDIVKQRGFLNNYYSSVCYAAGRFLVRDYETLLPTALGGISRYKIEVIGNIHDNPKLLNNFKNQ